MDDLQYINRQDIPRIMPTKREREYYAMGFRDGLESVQREADRYKPSRARVEDERAAFERDYPSEKSFYARPTKKRKLSAWNKYVKANSKKPRFRLRSGKLNLKKLGVAFRKTPAGKKKRR